MPPESRFRDRITADGSSGFKAEAGRYHLYVAHNCPWAHRTLITRRLKKLEEAIGVTVVDPIRDENGWAFRDGPGHSRDPINGFGFLRDAYVATKPDFQGRWTVPVLWDTQTRRIVIHYRTSPDAGALQLRLELGLRSVGDHQIGAQGEDALERVLAREKEPAADGVEPIRLFHAGPVEGVARR